MATPKSKAVVTIDLDTNELATVLAALRLFQTEFEGCSGAAITGVFPEHFKGIEPLGTEDIDTLCEQINCAEVR